MRPNLTFPHFEHYGLECRISTNALGCFCGHIAIEKGCLLYGENYMNIVGLSVHGGITYGEIENDKKYWIGFDCSHITDFIPMFQERGRIWTYDQVVAETKCLAEQVANLITQPKTVV